MLVDESTSISLRDIDDAYVEAKAYYGNLLAGMDKDMLPLDDVEGKAEGRAQFFWSSDVDVRMVKEFCGQYDIDAVTSKILRTGFKYNADLSKGWNWYAGLAYEYEFDGESTGRADGAPIRAASIMGGSALGEVGLHLSATEKNHWEADLNLHGSCGQHRGVGGNLSVAYRF